MFLPYFMLLGFVAGVVYAASFVANIQRTYQSASTGRRPGLSLFQISFVRHAALCIVAFLVLRHFSPMALAIAIAGFALGFWAVILGCFRREGNK